MKKILLLVLTLICLSQSVFAGQYLGFDLCKAADEESLKKIVEDAGGSWSGNLQATNYPIAIGKYAISLELYGGRLYSVKIESADGLDDLLRKKYGKPVRAEKNNTQYGTLFTQYFAVKSDPNIEIENNFAVIGYATHSGSLSYTCKDIRKKMLADENNAKEESIKSRNKGKPL